MTTNKINKMKQIISENLRKDKILNYIEQLSKVKYPTLREIVELRTSMTYMILLANNINVDYSKLFRYMNNKIPSILEELIADGMIVKIEGNDKTVYKPLSNTIGVIDVEIDTGD